MACWWPEDLAPGPTSVQCTWEHWVSALVPSPAQGKKGFTGRKEGSCHAPGGGVDSTHSLSTCPCIRTGHAHSPSGIAHTLESLVPRTALAPPR